MKHKEIEYKFIADISKNEFETKLRDALFGDDFHNVSANELKSMYFVSCDDYYTRNGSGSIMRFRKGNNEFELTIKNKLDSNKVREEINLDVTNNDDFSINNFLKLSGFKKEFQVYKEAWVWKSDKLNCVFSYYTISSGDNYIELEAESYSSISEGVGIIDYWTNKLGLNNLDLETRSLYEIYKARLSSAFSEQII